MSRQSLRTTFWGRGVVIAALVITAGVGFCLFDGDHDDDPSIAQDLCVGLIAVILGCSILVGPVLAGDVLAVSTAQLVTVPVAVLDPPPKSSSARS